MKPIFNGWKALRYKGSPWIRQYRIGRNSSISEWLMNTEGRKAELKMTHSKDLNEKEDGIFSSFP